MQFNQLNALYHRPLFDLIAESRAIHLEHTQPKDLAATVSCNVR